MTLPAAATPTRQKPEPAALRIVQCIANGLTVEMSAELTGWSYNTCNQLLKQARHAVAAKNTCHTVYLCLKMGWIN